MSSSTPPEAELRQLFDQVAELAAAENPEAEPYKSLYEARTLISEFLGQHQTTLQGDACLCRLKLGILFIQTEETGDGEKRIVAELAHATKDFCRMQEAAEHSYSAALLAETIVEANNQLAVVYCGWGEPAKALRSLRSAKGTYRTYSHTASVGSGVASDRLDALFTQTALLYAQVYPALGAPGAKSAEYCALALLRQLRGLSVLDAAVAADSSTSQPSRLHHGDAPEWVRNALRLSVYFSASLDWQRAAMYLTAGDTVLYYTAREACPPGAEISVAALPDALQRLCAEAGMHWGNLFAAALKAARDRGLRLALEGSLDAGQQAGSNEADGVPPFQPWVDAENSSDDDEANLAHSERGGEAMPSALPSVSSCESELVQLLLRLAPAVPENWSFCGPARIHLPQSQGSSSAALSNSSVRCPGHPVGHLPEFLPPARIRDFPAARDVFKATTAAYTRALGYFALEGFVTEHVAAKLATSRLYKHLAFFEADGKRRQAMHGRRVAMLSPLLGALNPALFINTIREMALELGNAAEDEFDSRCALVQAREAAEQRLQSPKEAANLLADSTAAINYYAAFIAGYKDPRLEGAVCIGGVAAAAYSEAPLAGATALDDESAEAYCTAHFRIAKLLFQRSGYHLGATGDVAASGARQKQDLKDSCSRFEWLLRTAPLLAGPAAADGSAELAPFFGAELELCREFTSLLPLRMRAMEQQR